MFEVLTIVQKKNLKKIKLRLRMRIFFIEQITSPSPVMVYNGTAKLIFVNGCGVKVIAILSIIVFGKK